MRRFRPYLIILAGLFVLLALVRTVFAEPIGLALFKQAAKAAAARDVTATWPEGLHAVLVGTGSPLADPKRAGPMTVIIAGERVFVIDAGGGAARNYQRFGLSADNVEAVFLTHFHSDHIDGLGEFLLNTWAGSGRAAPVPVYGPQGTAQILGGFRTAYTADAQYRVAHHGNDVVPMSGFGGASNEFDASPGAVRVYEKDGLTVTAVPVSHAPAEPAVAYRFDYQGRSVTISGDTAKSESLAALARDTDLLIHEALNTDFVGAIEAGLETAGRDRTAKIMADIPSYHTTPVGAAETAASANARALVLSHIVPALPNRFLERAYLKGTKAAYDGPLIVGQDGMVFSLPAKAGAMERRRLR
jgi:ribonuclease Z